MSSKKSTTTKHKQQFLNKKATYEYEILERFEAGISLEGSEIKAIRKGQINLKESYIKIINNEAWLLNSHITHISTTHKTYRPDENRDRKLLLKRKEIDKLNKKVAKDGLSIVVLKLYFNQRNLLKATIALARGKKLHDKREAIKQKTQKRDAQIAMKNYQ
ncbi:MAG: SsrA-binding protein [Campylobacteraceae bacterium 4484_166]|nr:MAG: SsrA-binding protein [Campylobacteraceae bacterium 4484_166]